MGTLYIVATPIGNLEDISERALRILREVDRILCEDTRVSQKLLDHYGIATRMVSYHQHSRLTKVQWVTEQLRSGRNFALVSDAGTPGISDPGNALIAAIVRDLNDAVKIVPIPGPTAATAAASVAGIRMDRFLFFGFPPHKKGRQTYFTNVLVQSVPVLFYESPHRITKTLAMIAAHPEGGMRHLVVARELTKVHEETLRGTAQEILAHFDRNPDHVRGEFVVIVPPRGKKRA